MLSAGLLWVLPLELQAQFYFGRNKIQYQEFEWQMMETPHFQVYYYTDEEQLARAAAYWAEEAFVDYEQKFNHTLNRMVPLVIYSNDIHFQQTNTIPMFLPEAVAGFFEFVKGRVVLPSNGSLADFKRVVRHELVHVFMHSKINSAGRDMGIWEQRAPPLWFTEGLAEWWAEGWDSQAEMVIRDAVLHDYLVPLEKLTLGGAGFLLYKEGQSFIRFFEANYGTDRVRLLMEQFYFHETFDDLMEAVTGDPFKEISQRWRLSLKQAAAGSLARQDIPAITTEPLTRKGANVSPCLYLDHEGRTHLVYLSTRDGYTSVYEQVLGRPGEKLLLRGERSPGLESLHFLRSGMSINKNGTLAFVAKSYERDRIKLIDLGSKKELGEFKHPQLITIRSPSWSPDGNVVVFSAQNTGGQSDLYSWEVAGQQAVQLTDDFYHDQDPDFSHDGSAIVFSSDRGQPTVDAGQNLFVYHLASKQIRQLTGGKCRDRHPRWSEHSPATVRFVSDRGGTPNVWELDIAQYQEIDPQAVALTDLHTGAVDFVALQDDSLLVNTFENYGFQLQMAATQAAEITEPLTPPSAAQAWRPPGLTGQAIDKPRPYKLKYSLDLAQTAIAYDPIFDMLGGVQLALSDMLGNRY
ncbi:MAG: PD40 domain-containing protein, partial [Candidatus Marinimicrobia bacterium]|nr:PD40 domain-containing protein [Candidatus Neomarinimicrobiota bacterium]